MNLDLWYGGLTVLGTLAFLLGCVSYWKLNALALNQAKDSTPQPDEDDLIWRPIGLIFRQACDDPAFRSRQRITIRWFCLAALLLFAARYASAMHA